MESIVLRNGFARYLELDGNWGRPVPERDRIEYGIHTRKNRSTERFFLWSGILNRLS